MIRLNLDWLAAKTHWGTWSLIQRKDGQWTFKVGSIGTDSSHSYDVLIETRLSTYNELFRLAHVVESLRTNGLVSSIHLKAKSLLGMRADQIEENGGIDLLPIARFINSLNFSSVKVLEPHSLGTIISLKNSKPYYVPWMQSVIDPFSYDILVSPDAGAYKTNSKRVGLSKSHISVSKHRDVLGTPHLLLPFNEIKQIESEDGICRVLIIDDYIDGGRSFVELAEQLKKIGVTKVILAACHGLFSYGLESLFQHIDEIWTTDSLSNQSQSVLENNYSDVIHIIEAP
jgi:ribose-phosphate pyrophosphokinase